MNNRKITQEYLKQYGEMFRNARTAANRTQKEISEAVCCSSCVISFIENGYMLPPEHIEIGLLAALGENGYIDTDTAFEAFRIHRVESITPYGYSKLSKKLQSYVRKFKSKEITLPRMYIDPEQNTCFLEGFIKAFEILSDVCEKTAIETAKRDMNSRYGKFGDL